MKQNSITWQQLPSSITFLIGTLVVLAAIFGTTAVNQYRQAQYEKNQDEIRQEIKDIRSADIRSIQKDITDIKLFIGMGKQSFIRQPSITQSLQPTFTPAPVSQSVQMSSITPQPTLQSTPQPTLTPIQILDDITDAVKGILP